MNDSLIRLKWMEQLPLRWVSLTLGTLGATLVLGASLLPVWIGMLLALGFGVLVWTTTTALSKRTDFALRESERKFRDFVEQSLFGLYVAQDDKLVYVNSKTAELLGYDSPGQLIGMPLSQLTAPEDLARLRENQRRRLAGEVADVRYTYRALRRDCRRVWVEVHGSVCQYEGRQAIMGIVLDVSQQVEFERQSRLANRVFDSASEGIVITDADCRIEAVNPAFTRITGYRPEEAMGRLSRMMTGQGARVNQAMLTRLNADGHWQGEMRDRRKGGDWYPAWLSISTVRDDENGVINYVGVFTDNTRRKEAETRLQFMAAHDSLTGMLNRSGMMTRIAEEIERAGSLQHQLALLFIDLDRFKAVNDTMGHLAGDRLLVAAAQRMRAELSGADLVARLGGDEFTVVIDDAPGSGTAEQLAERLLASMALPFQIEGQEMFVTASIGVARFPGDGTEAATLLKNADVAMYRAKERGRNTCQFFTSDMGSSNFAQLMLENSLRRALERSEFELHYQPQYAASTGHVSGIEALIRWRRPEVGLVPPGAFIGLAEQNGLIVPIGAWVLHEACRQAKAWLDAGYQFGQVAVNLSARQFAAGDLLDTIRAALASSGLPPTLLELEITESTIMQNPQEAVTLLGRFREMGVAIAVDDFGTGYSSLASLKQYPLDSLKIDRSFIAGVPTDVDDVAITEAIIAVAHKLGLTVVAEGVETKEQSDFLRLAGCDFAQGYLMGRPMPAAELEAQLSRQ